MSEIKNNKNNMNFSFKINHISLFKKSDFNFSLQKQNIPKSKLIAIKELHNSKDKEKPFDIFLNQTKNLNIVPIIKENKNKINPLAEKTRIIRRHNMLRRIDFNINSIKSIKYSNKNLELNSYNTINDNLFFGNNGSNFNNNNKSNNYNYNYNYEKTIDLPFLTINSEEKSQSYKTFDLKNNDNINLFKDIKNTLIINNFSPSNISSPSIKYVNILKKYMKVLSNDKKKKAQSQNKRQLKLNYTDQSMIMDKKIDFSSNFENNKNNRNKKNIFINTDNKSDESSSNDDNCDVKEIEKIISKSSHTLNPTKKKNYTTNIKFLNNSRNAGKKDYIFLNNLYRMKNDDINSNHFNENRTSHNSFMKNLSNKINLKTQGNINIGRNHHYYKSLKCFNQSNTIDENNIFFLRKNKKIDTNLMPYNYKRKIM